MGLGTFRVVKSSNAALTNNKQACGIITTRPIMIVLAMIISPQSYWVVRSCEIIAYMLDDPSTIVDSYPSCAAYADGRNEDQVSPVRARVAGASDAAEVAAALEIGFVTGLWLAFLIHVSLTELYVSLPCHPPHSIEIRKNRY